MCVQKYTIQVEYNTGMQTTNLFDLYLGDLCESSRSDVIWGGVLTLASAKQKARNHTNNRMFRIV